MMMKKNFVKLIAGSMAALTIMTFASTLPVYASTFEPNAYYFIKAAEATAATQVSKFHAPKQTTPKPVKK